MLRTLLLATIALCFSVGPVQSDDSTQEKPSRRQLVQDRAKLFAEHRSAQEAGRIDEAIAAAERIAEIERQLIRQLESAETAEDEQFYASLQNSLAGALAWLSARFEEGEHFEKAISAQREVVALQSQRLGSDHQQTAGARVRLVELQALAKLTADQRKQLRKADQLRAQAFQLFNQGEPDKALQLEQRVLATRRQILGADAPQVASTRYDVGFLLHHKGDLQQSLEHLRRSERHRRQLPGRTHPDWERTVELLADVLNRLGEQAIAEERFEEAGQYQSERLTCLFDRYGAADWRVTDATRSVAQVVRLAALTQKERNELAKAAEMNARVAKLRSTGKYPPALPLAQSALEIRKRVLGEEHPDTATSLNNLAGLYESIGDYAQAAPLYKQSLEIIKKVLGEEHPNYATSLNNLAGLYESMGDYAQAEPLYTQSLEIFKKVLGEGHPHTAISLDDLAGLYDSMGDYAQAEPLYKQSLEIYKKVLGEEHPHTATSLNNLAVLYQSMGDYVQAEPLYKQSLEIRKKILGEERPDTATSLNNLAVLYHSMGDYAQAGELARRSLTITREHLETTSAVLSERQQLAMNQMLRYRLDACVSIDASRENHAAQTFRDVLAWKGATLVRQAAMRQLADQPEIAETFRQLQRITMQLASLTRIVPEAKGLGQWSDRLRRLRNEKEKLESQLSRRSAEFRAAKQGVALEDLHLALPDDSVLVDFLEYTHLTPSQEKKGQFDFERSLVAFVVRPDRDVQRVDLGAVAGLPEDIDTWRQTFGMSPPGKTAGNRLRERLWKPLLPHFEGAKTVIVSPDGVLGRLPLGALPGREAGTYLLEDHRLVLVPVPQLIPALVNEKGRRTFAKDLLLMGDVNYNGETETDDEKPRRRLKPSERRGDNTALVRSKGKLFDPLKGAAGEIAFIKKLYDDLYGADAVSIARLEKENATEQRFRELAPQCFQLHLATHGFFASHDKQSALNARSADDQRGRMFSDQEHVVRGFSPGLLSGLAFSGANEPPQPDKDDGILTADEIAFLPLDGVNLVVLSACETGLGEVAGGEGLIGIQRAFQVSGARSTVASLWKVPDQATRILMERFYENYLDKEMSRLDALREAQLWVLNNPDSLRGVTRADEDDKNRRTPPEYWAAFVLSGDWR